MKQYIASYQNKKDECWDLIMNVNSYKEALKLARKQQKEYGKLWRVNLLK